MAFVKNFYVNSTAKTDIHLITHDVKRAVRESDCQDGMVLLLIPGATAGVTLLEEDPKIHQQYCQWVEEQIPESEGSRPNRRSGTGRISAHLRAALVGVQLAFPLERGKLMIGPWQEVVLMDFDDKVGRREFTIQVFGESGGK